MRKKLVAVALASAIAGGIIGVTVPAQGQTYRPIRAIVCKTTLGGYTYLKYVGAYTYRVECGFGARMVGLQFG